MGNTFRTFYLLWTHFITKNSINNATGKVLLLYEHFQLMEQKRCQQRNRTILNLWRNSGVLISLYVDSESQLIVGYKTVHC